MTARLEAVKSTLDVLRRYYADRDGQPVKLNDTQIAVYLDGLGGYSADQLESAARQHMRQSQFFPKVSELLALLSPPTDFSALAHAAWARLERECRRIGAYRSVQFVDPAFGETVRQVFGSWSSACSFDVDSPAWAIRRQTFLAIFPQVAQRQDVVRVTLRGLIPDSNPAIVGHIEGMPAQALLPAATDHTRQVLAEVSRRFELLKGRQS